MRPANDCVFDHPLAGRLGIVLAGAAICRVYFLDARTPLRSPTSAAARRARRALQAVLDDPHARPEVELQLNGTAFQRRVWAELQRIPPGRVCTYGELAQRLGSGARAVGNACRRNPVPLLVPCHRVVPVRGIGGFAGARGGRWVALKRSLLAREGVEIG
ncbi:MAG TPA: MGMT family protein [Gammaproteobacteria bacterium]|nr:MGMT family protein [Gammaproteobacteria bacterium]